MEIVHTFGIEPTLLIAQIVNFLIILFILKRYVYKPVLSMLEKRKNEIKMGLQNAQDAQKLLEKTKEEEKNILKNAQNQANKIISEAKDSASELTKENEEKIKKQTQTMINEAKEHILEEAKVTEQRIMQNVTKIAIQILEKSLTGLVNARAQDEILDKTQKELKKK